MSNIENNDEKNIKVVNISKNETYDLSIILPVYNVEKYLDKCLFTLLNQELENFELIIVNDGTKDNSEEIIKKYLNKSNFKDKITYVIQENGGLSSARNTGYSFAKGEYVTFFDSDDYIKSNMYKNMIQKTKNFKYDVVTTNLYMRYVDENLNIIRDQKVSSNLKENLEKITDEQRAILFKNIYVAVHNKIYKKEVLDKLNLKFIEGMVYEDVVFTYKLLCHIETIANVEEYSYYYIQRTGSISNTYSNNLYDILKSVEILNEYFNDPKVLYANCYKQDVLDYITLRYTFGTFILRLSKVKNYKKYIKGYNDAKKVVKQFKKVPFNKNSLLNGILAKSTKKDIVLKNFNIFIASLIYFVNRFKK